MGVRRIQNKRHLISNPELSAWPWKVWVQDTRRHPYGPARQADINFFSVFFSSFNFKSAPQTLPET